MTKNHSIIILIALILLFIVTDHVKRPALDHELLETWRISGAIGACAPCGAVCDKKT